MGTLKTLLRASRIKRQRLSLDEVEHLVEEAGYEIWGYTIAGPRHVDYDEGYPFLGYFWVNGLLEQHSPCQYESVEAAQTAAYLHLRRTRH